MYFVPFLDEIYIPLFQKWRWTIYKYNKYISSTQCTIGMFLRETRINERVKLEIHAKIPLFCKTPHGVTCLLRCAQIQWGNFCLTKLLIKLFLLSRSYKCLSSQGSVFKWSIKQRFELLTWVKWKSNLMCIKQRGPGVMWVKS